MIFIMKVSTIYVKRGIFFAEWEPDYISKQINKNENINRTYLP